ncbi:MAG TPA: hypothetical protein VGM78_11925 [Ilumatobacteraceae bacterium]|jgi:hypothetical protein
MNANTVQQRIDELQATTPQRWLVNVIIVVAPLVACVAAALASRRDPTFVMVVVAALAVASAARPDSELAVLVIIAVVWDWLAVVHDVANPWVVLVAVGLLVFHAAVAFAAMAPSSATIHGDVVRRWWRRTVVVSGVTVGVWAIVAVLHHRRATGSAALAIAAMVCVAVLAVGLRSSALRRR